MIRFCLIYYAYFSIIGIVYSQQWTMYTLDNSGLVDNQVRSIVIDNLGIKWIGTSEGLCRYDGVEWTTFTTDDNLAGNEINDIGIEYVNLSEVLWIGTIYGISYCDIPEILYIDGPLRVNNTELISDVIKAIAIDQSQVKWFGTDSGLSAFDGQEWKTFTRNDVLLNNHIQSIATTQDGWKYIGTKGGGVTRLHSENIDAITSASPLESTWSGLLSDSVYAIFIDSSGIQWYGTDAGVSSHVGENSKENWTIYTTDDGLVHNFVQAIAQDQGGKMWFGTPGGVSSLNVTEWETFTVENGLSDNTVHDIAIDLDNSVWFATDSGLSRYSNSSTSIEPVTNTEGFNSISIRTFPNPFNSHTTFEVYLGIDRFFFINIYNVLGQNVRTINLGEKRNGRLFTRWDGLDDEGHTVPSGIYMAQVTDGVNSAFTKIVLVK